MNPSSMDSDMHEIEADIEISSPGLNSLVLVSFLFLLILNLNLLIFQQKEMIHLQT